MSKNLLKIIRVYGVPAIIFLLLLEVIAAAIGYHYDRTQDIAHTNLLVSSALIVLCATFAGIYVPTAIAANKERERSHKTVRHMLGLVRMELYANKYVIDQINNNFTFAQIIDIDPFDRFLNLTLKKIEAINAFTSKFLKDAFVASQTSPAVTAYDSDDLSLMVHKAYDDLQYLEVQIEALLVDLRLKKYITEGDLEDIGTPDEVFPQWKSEVQDRIELISQGATSTGLQIDRAIEILNRDFGGPDGT